MPKPDEMARIAPKAPWRREQDAYEAACERDNRAYDLERQHGKVTESKAYRAEAAKLGLLR